MKQIVNVNELTIELRRGFDALKGREVGRCASMAINRTLAKNRVFIGREIRNQYNMNVFDAKSQIVQGQSTPGTLRGTLSGNAAFTPFEYFKVSGESNITGDGFKLKRAAAKYAIVNGKKQIVARRTVSTGSGRHSTFTVSISKGKSSLFTHAFIANTKNGPMLMNRGLYSWRTNQFSSVSRRLPMERLRTLSVWQEMTSKGIVGKSSIVLKQDYGKELYRLMNVTLSGKGWK